MKIRFSSTTFNCNLKWLSYENGNVAIVASDAEDGSPVATLSVNPGEKVPKDLVAIKDYSENTGVLQSLIDNGVIGEPLYYIESGYVQIPVCKILNKNL